MAGQDQLESVPLPGRDDGDAVEESEIAEQAWILRKSLDKRPCERSRIGFRSALLGLIGLAVLLAALASLLVVGASTILEEVEEDELYFIAFLETLYLPSMMAFVYISVVVMFWHRPIWQRFALGFLLVAPGVYLLLQLANLFLDFSWVDAPEILLALLIQFFASSVVGLMAQLWTPWTLSEARESGQQPRPTGTRELFELTAVVAAGIALLMAIPARVYDGVHIPLFLTLGVFMASAILVVVVGSMSESWAIRWFTMGLAGAVCSGLMFAVFIVLGEGLVWAATNPIVNWLSLIVAAAYGGLICIGTIWICGACLRGCGWRCLNRRRVEAEPAARPA